jgi:hypothetical protein
MAQTVILSASGGIGAAPASRKFPLAAGTYTVQLSGNPGAETRVMLSFKP